MDGPVRIEVAGDAIELRWSDGTVDHLEAATLRRACPCAACAGGAAPVPVGSSIATARVVGDYALGITFGPDGHATGIYPFELLRSLGAVA